MSFLVERAGSLGYPALAPFCCGYLLSCTGSAMVPVALTFAIYEQGP